MQRSTAFDYVTFERAVEIVTEGTAFFSPEYLAGQYAFDGADEAGYGLDAANMEGHLDVLVEAGAKFNYAEALKTALQFAADAE